MRLPEPLSEAVKPLSARHARWHAARLSRDASRRGPGTEFPALRGIDEPGSGEQFLAFHRAMLREFEAIVSRHPETGFVLDRWSRFPSWLADFFAWAQPGFLPGALARTREIVATASADDLGSFLESTRLSAEPLRGLHALAHANVAAYEEHRFGAAHPRLRGAAMDSAESSPHNEHFWSLHAWIDGFYEDLLRRAGGDRAGRTAAAELFAGARKS
jgi:hypothetical protein